MKTTVFLALLVLVILAAPRAAGAQRAASVPRIGLLTLVGGPNRNT
jgi:hypothetical protein